MIDRRRLLALLASAGAPGSLWAAESPLLKDAVADGSLPEMSKRLPKNPRVINLSAMGREPGRTGGTVRLLVGRQKDIRLMQMNSYSRLVGFDENLDLQPDILESYEIEEGRIFTFKLREGHRWSDGSPFTSEDFRYVYEDVEHNLELRRGGPSTNLKVDGVVAKFEVLDELTVRYSWPKPAPHFLPKLAGPIPFVLALPSAYLKQFHASYQSEDKLMEFAEANRVDSWRRLHTKLSRQNRPENPDLPTLEAWRPRTAPPAEQFVFERNPYFHRVDENGIQLPYIDRWLLNVASSEIITAKTATGESDLQMTGIGFTDYTLLKQAEATYPQKVSLWTRAQGSSVAILPNLNYKDPVWRELFRDVRMRRGLSLAINRAEINKVLFYGLARESANTVLPESPLFKPEYASAWSTYDPDQANELLDAAGLQERDIYGTRKLPDGRQAGIIIESAGESTLETDVLELVTDHFRDVGLRLYIRTSQRDVFRSRALGGDVMMSVWLGLDNAVPTADMPPTALAPTAEDQLQWPVWGLHYMSAETSGSPPDLPEPARLVELLNQWRRTTSTEERTAIWHQMLEINADQVFSIGTVNSALQPVVRSSRLRNVPEKALYGFAPTSYLGAYMPDTFWYDGEG